MKPHKYLVTRLFIGGTLKGVLHTGPTSVWFRLGQEVEPRGGGSPYRITKIEPNPAFWKPNFGGPKKSSVLAKKGS